MATYQLTQTGAQVQANLDAVEAGDIVYLTTAPEAVNTSGKLKIVVLETEPTTRYTGYIYIITTAPAAPGYRVTVYNDAYNNTFTLYDGQDNTGTYLGTIAYAETKTVQIESGYIVAYMSNGVSMFYGNFYVSSDTFWAHPLGNPCQIIEDTSLTIRNSGGSND